VIQDQGNKMGLYELLGAQTRKPSGLAGRLLGHSMAWGHKALTRWAMASMGIQSKDHVLDIGCGSGMAVKLIARTAVDGFVAIRHGSVSALPYENDSFDKVIAVETFYFWPNPIADLKEVRRVLKPGGLVALAMEGSKDSSNPQKHIALSERMGFPLYSGAEIEDMLIAAGFSQTWFESAPGKGWGWLCALGLNGNGG